MNKAGLVIRLAIVIIFTAIVVGLISTQLFYRFTFLNEQALGEERISQLYNTVSPTASIASYLSDEELAKEVVNGLITNDVITASAIQTSAMLVASKLYKADDELLEFTLYSPFQQERRVGTLFIKVNKAYIESKAAKLSATNSYVVALEAVIITLISILVTYFVITKPILGIGSSLHKTHPGTQERIRKPMYHQRSEIGLLVDDVNGLLDKAEQQMLQEKSLRTEVQVLESRFRMLFEHASSAIVLIESQGDILLYNEAFEQLINKLDLPLKKNYGNFLQDIFCLKKEFQENLQLAFSNKESATAELELISPTQEKVWVQVVVTQLLTDDYLENYQITLHDISKRKQQISLLDQQANYDALTKLLNRHAAEQYLKQLVNNHQEFSFILMDLNNFKPINDVFGHDAGDEVLIHVSSQMMKSLRKEDILSRWGGDEFVIIIPSTDEEEVTHVCYKLYTQLCKSHHLPEHDKSVFVTASMGVSRFPHDAHEPIQLVKLADKAMYNAKHSNSKNEQEFLMFAHNMPSNSYNTIEYRHD